MTLNALPLVNNVMVSPFCIFFRDCATLTAVLKYAHLRARARDRLRRLQARQILVCEPEHGALHKAQPERPIVRPRLCPV